jgi:hypothetical protein
MPASADTLIRLVRAAPMPMYPAPRVIGLDKWAWRRGRRYGTMIVDLSATPLSTSCRTVTLRPSRAGCAAIPVSRLSRDRAEVFAERDPCRRSLACDLRAVGTHTIPMARKARWRSVLLREPCPPKCCYPDVRRSDPTCEAPGTTAPIWKHRSGGGPAEDGRLNASERPMLRSVIGNRPKVLSGRRQNGTRVGSSIVSIDDGGNSTRRTIGRSLSIRFSPSGNRVSPTRPAAARRRYPDREEGHGGGGRGAAEQAKAAL